MSENDETKTEATARRIAEEFARNVNENTESHIRKEDLGMFIYLINAGLKRATLTEREACVKLFKQRLEGLSAHARNHIHEDQTRFDIRHKARLAVAEELLSWLATAIRGRNSTDE